MERATAALIPFVDRWNLPLNPEHLAEMAGAVLEHAPGEHETSDAAFIEIDRAVNKQLDEFAERMEDLYKDR